MIQVESQINVFLQDTQWTKLNINNKLNKYHIHFFAATKINNIYKPEFITIDTCIDAHHHLYNTHLNISYNCSRLYAQTKSKASITAAFNQFLQSNRSVIHTYLQENIK